MSAFQPYRRPFPRVARAVANRSKAGTEAEREGSDTLPDQTVASVASVASVAAILGAENENGALPGQSVANVASAAGVENENGALGEPKRSKRSSVATGGARKREKGALIPSLAGGGGGIRGTKAPLEKSGTGGRACYAATLATVGDNPAAWRDGLLSLTPDLDRPWRLEDDPCPGFPSRTWPRVWASALAFVDTHGAEAHRCGWTALELFGVHPVVGAVRVDCCGALMLACAGPVLAVEADRIRYENGLTFRRVRPASQAATGGAFPVPVWAFGRGVDQ